MFNEDNMEKYFDIDDEIKKHTEQEKPLNLEKIIP